jgi:hypothetical protein
MRTPLLFCLIAIAAPGESQTTATPRPAPAVAKDDKAPGGSKFLAPGIREWTYELQIHGLAGIHFDPYFVNTVLLGSSLSHGSRRNAAEGSSSRLTVRASGPAVNGEQRLELDEAAKKTFFGPSITKASLVVISTLDSLAENHPWNFKGQDKDGTYKPLLPFPQAVLALEIRGTMDMKGDDPWILSEMLAFVPADGKTAIDHLGWSSRLLSEPVELPAGSFKRVFHSRRPRGDGRNSERHTLESWVAEGVGLIKAAAVNQAGAPIYSLQLVSYK